MRKYGKKDSNHKEIVLAYLALGAVCFDMSAMGNGFPDLLVWYKNNFYLVEIKSKDGKLTKDQIKFIYENKIYGIKVHVVKTKIEALSVIGIEI